MKTKNKILHLLSTCKPTAESKYGLTRIGIFGSVARGEQTKDSDVDVCYEGRMPSLLTLDLIQTSLERMPGSRVDLVRVRDGMNSLLKERIGKEAAYVWPRGCDGQPAKIRKAIETILERAAVVSAP